MKFVRRSNVNEMILEFLKAEYKTERFKDFFKQEAADFYKVIENGNLKNKEENELRVEILSKYRGFRRDALLFYNFPQKIKWKIYEIEACDLNKLYFIKTPEFGVATDFSYSFDWLKRNLDKVNSDFKSEMLRGGQQLVFGKKFRPLIFLTSNMDEFMCLEGNHRLAIYSLHPDMLVGTTCILGRCSKNALIYYDLSNEKDCELLIKAHKNEITNTT